MPRYPARVLNLLLTAGLLILLVSASGCRAKVKTGTKARDIQFANGYLNDLPREHYGIALCAAADSRLITDHPEKPDPSGDTYKYRKISKGKSIEIIKQLVRRRVDVDSRMAGRTALTVAAMNGHPEIVRALLLRGANPLLTDREKKTALEHALANKHSEVAELLQKALNDIASVNYAVPAIRSMDLHKYEFPARDTTRPADTLRYVPSASANGIPPAGTTDSSRSRIVERELPGGRVYSTRVDPSRGFTEVRTIAPPASILYDTPPALIGKLEPKYPREALRNGLTAVVGLDIRVVADGSASEITIYAPASAEFNEAALAAARSASFKPALKNGIPVNARLRLSIAFKIRS